MTDTHIEDGVEPDAADLDDDEDYLQPNVSRRIPWPTALLAIGVIAGLAFTGGVLVQKHHERSSTPANGLPSGLPPGLSGLASGNLPAGIPGAGGGLGSGGQSGGTGAAPGATSTAPVVVGTVSSVRGTTVKVKDLGGTTHTVKTSADTTLARPGIGASGALVKGETVSVTGTKSDDGTITATGITVR
jgi:hypothetical protein